MHHYPWIVRGPSLVRGFSSGKAPHHRGTTAPYNMSNIWPFRRRYCCTFKVEAARFIYVYNAAVRTGRTCPLPLLPLTPTSLCYAGSTYFKVPAPGKQPQKTEPCKIRFQVPAVLLIAFKHIRERQSPTRALICCCALLRCRGETFWSALMFRATGR